MFLQKILSLPSGVSNLIKFKAYKKLFNKCGNNVNFGQNFSISTPPHIELGNHVSIGPNALFMTTRAMIKIGDYVMSGPGLTIITGDHRTDLVGRIMMTVRDNEKLPENDMDVTICGDNWIGANVTILKGVTVGQGSIIAAGSVVTKNIPEYEIWGGVPAKKIKDRFDSETLIMHKKEIASSNLK